MASAGMHEKGIDTVLKELNSSRKGLSESEARKRLARYGPNILKREKKISRLAIFLNQFKSILVVILIVAAVISAFVLSSMLDSVVIMIIVALNGVFGYIQEYRAEKSVEALKKMTTPEATVIRDGRQKKIESRLLVPGDIVVLDQGTRIPADMRLIDTINLKIDEAALTGESIPVTKTLEPVKDVQLSDRKCMSYMGTLVTYGRGTGIVTGTGMKTEIGKIAHLIEEAEEEPTPLQKKLDVFGRNLAIIIIVISIMVILIMFLRSGDLFGGGDPQKSAILLGIALAIAAIPEGLPAIVTITMALGLQRLSKNNALIRRLPAVETLGSTSVICSDKTGTLTRNEMMVTKIYSDSKLFDVTGKGYSTQGNFLFNGKKIEPGRIKSLSTLLKTAVLCNNASLGEKDSIIGDPTEGALVVAAAKAFNVEQIKKKYPRKSEFPFSSERKRMSTINDAGGKLNSYVKGAPEIIIDRCTHVFKNGKTIKLTSQEKKNILSVNYTLSLDALRILGFAFKRVKNPHNEEEAETELVFLGLMGMIDPPRTEVRELIISCKRAGIKVVMITGDHRNTAIAIAKELHIFREGHKALTGEKIDSLGDKELEKIVESVTVYARVNPEHKLKIVKALQKKHTVAMTGDGVNDAPALKKADIGVAMGIKGTDVAKEASEMILRDDNFSTIVSAIEEGRAVYDNIKKFIQYLLSSNLGEVMVIFLSLLIFSDPANPAAVIVPVTVIQLLWINLLTDGLPATALGVDPPAPGIMKRPPRNPRENILNREMLTDIVIVGIIITAGTLFVFNLNFAYGEKFARTAAFTTLVMFEMVRVQGVRMKYGQGILTNKKLVLAIAISIFLQLVVIYVPFLQQIFGTVALGIIEWLEIILVSVSVMIIMEIKRWAGKKLFSG